MTTNKKQIEKAVDTAFDKAINAAAKSLSMELYPDAFANPNSWLCVKKAIDINNNAIRAAIKTALIELLADQN